MYANEQPKTVRILYMEDDSGLARLFQKKMNRRGYEVDLAFDGKEGLVKYTEGTYDVVVVDHQMPLYNGLQVIQSMAAEGRLPAIIMLTGAGNEKIAVEAMKLGASDYIIKDINGGYFDLMPSLIKRALDQNRLAVEKEEAEKALRQSEKRFREMAALLPTAICELDIDMRVIYVNKAGANIFGYSQAVSPADVLVMDMVHPDERARALERFGQICRGMKIETEEYRLIKNDGSEITVLINAAPMYGDEKICGARISITDITHRRRLEVQLQSAQKMKAITTLAGGIAHEFNNALVGITGNIELLKMNLEEDKDVDKYIEKMIGSAGRMAKHTKQLLAYARGGKYWPKIISLRALVEDALALIRHTIQPSIRVQTDLRDDASHVEVDVTQMQLVLSAVLTNASEAIEGDGLIRIVIGNQEIIETSMDEHPGLKPGHYACLTIEDDGKGMESETRDRIFEPFFTTNFQGRGLGMAATYGIVKNHNGWIGIDSEPGKGTTVRIYLPAIDA